MCHIVIIGSGITGVTSAYELSQLGYKVTVIDNNIDKNIGKNTGREAFDVKKFFCYSELNYGKQEYKSVWILKWEKLSK